MLFFQAKAAGNANNDWKLSHRLISERWDETTLGPKPEYEAVKDVFEEIYQGGLWKTENLLVDPELFRKLQAAGIPMVRTWKLPIIRAGEETSP